MHIGWKAWIARLQLIALAVLPLAHADAKPGGDSVVDVSLATATPGGGFQLYGAQFAEVLNAAGEGWRIEPVASRGSRENLQLLDQGRVDLALVEGNAARQVLEDPAQQAHGLRILSVMYPNPGLFAVSGDSPHRSIDDLRGRPIAFGTRASGLRILARDVLDGLGLSPDGDFVELILDKAAEGPRLVLSGRADALWGAGIAWPGFVRLADSATGARFIAPTGAQIEAILKRHPHLRRMSVPAGTYRGQTQSIESVGLWSLILTRADLPDDLAYRLAEAIHRHQGTLAQRFAQGRYTSAENTVQQVDPGRLHPGAARYYRSAGLLQ